MASRALQAIFNTPWAMSPEMLETMISIAERSNDSVEAVAAKLGRELDNTYNATIRDGTAIIPVNGALFRRASWFAMVSGATSVEMMAKDFNSALEAAGVHSILLEIDSPGGDVNGISEFAEMIFKARGQKDIYAHISGYGCSGAYYIAAAAGHICAAPMSIVGSIGVIASYRDTTERDAKAGVRTIQIISNQSPDKRLNPDSDEGRAKLQQMVDDLADVFVSDVARYRGIATDKVLSDFGQGGSMVASKAKESGMIDSIGTFEDLLASIQAKRRGSASREGYAAQDASMEAEGDQMKGNGMIARITAAFKAALENDPELKAMEESPETPQAAGLPPVSSSGENKDLEEARRELAASREKLIEVQAEAWASGLVQSCKMMPAQKEKAVTALIQAAKDDFAAGEKELMQGPRASSIKQVFDAATPHTLTQELPAEVKQQVIQNQAVSPGQDGDVSPTRMAELMAQSPLGRSILDDAARHAASNHRAN